ncbi:diguanylate cyclase [Shewanella sp. C32]|uniref:diguanylate cyclase n=1 Tax=Shewanella electrica TaxID=515560 RepID=A0ABT2FGI0_9GAMM|nr:diguanylate cyclase [Shewanella electrica]MCH1923244.1 diguanylate cyclase [Shewanella electrica]MCS4555341.1 diguanylate cyclase [Shewanella electrica]
MATLAVQAIIRYYWVLPQLDALAQYNDRLEVLRVKNQIYQRLKLHSNFAYDNAVWDEAYHATLKRDATWFQTNYFIKQTFAKQKFNGIFFYDNSGKLITGLSVDKQFNALTTPEFTEQQRYQPLLISAADIANNQSTPLLRLQFAAVLDQPAAIFSHSIAPTNETGPTAGTLVIWQFIDDDFVERLSLEDSNPIAIHTGEILDELFQHLSAELLVKGVNAQIYQQHLLIGVRDIQGRPLLAFSFNPSPRLYDQSYLASSTMVGLLLIGSILIVSFAIISIRLVRPIIRLLHTVNHASLNNDYSVRTHLKGRSELFLLAEKIDYLLEVVEQQQHKLTEQNQQLAQLSNTDALTGLANRRSLDNYLAGLASQAANSELALSLLVIDVDNFKAYNDTFGHAKGDKVLKQVAEALEQLTHGATDLVARYGGEEFVIALEATDAENAAHVAANLCRGIAALAIPQTAASEHSVVTISIGIASKAAEQPLHPRELFDMADAALYQAKQQGRNQYVVAN